MNKNKDNIEEEDVVDDDVEGPTSVRRVGSMIADNIVLFCCFVVLFFHFQTLNPPLCLLGQAVSMSSMSGADDMSYSEISTSKARPVKRNKLFKDRYKKK